MRNTFNGLLDLIGMGCGLIATCLFVWNAKSAMEMDVTPILAEAQVGMRRLMLTLGFWACGFSAASLCCQITAKLVGKDPDVR